MDFNEALQGMIETAVNAVLATSIAREESFIRMHGGKEYISRHAACQALNVGRDTLQGLIDSGALTETEIGIRVRDMAHIPPKKAQRGRKRQAAFERVTI